MRSRTIGAYRSGKKELLSGDLQRKVIKYNHLVANMVILYDVQWMSRKLKELQEKGHPVDAEVLKVLSPYRREHINQFEDYLLDLLRPVPPLDPTVDFALKSAV